MNQSKSLLGVAGLLTMVALATPGCATKKYVRQTVDPVNQRVSEVDKKHTEAVAQLSDKEAKDVSRVDERAAGAENRANEGVRLAQQAGSKADQAAQTAQSAQQLAQQNQSKLGDVEKMVNNIDNYKLVSSEAVLFGFDKAQLTPDAKSKLDSILANADKNRAVFEIEGFTDRTGAKDYNLALSRRRADAVVRYLVSKDVPLRRIHMLGLGSEQPAATETSANASATGTQTTEQAKPRSRREMRKEMRRVVVRLYMPENAMTASSGQTGMTGTGSTQTQSTTPR